MITAGLKLQHYSRDLEMEKRRRSKFRAVAIALATAALLGGACTWSTISNARKPQWLVSISPMTLAGYTFNGKVFGPALFGLPGSTHQDKNFGPLSVETRWQFEFLTNNGVSFVSAGYQAESVGLEFGPSGGLRFFVNDARLGDSEWKVRVRSWPTYHFESKLVDCKVNGVARHWISHAQPRTMREVGDSAQRIPQRLIPEADMPGSVTNFPPMLSPDFEFGWLRADNTPKPKGGTTDQGSWMQSLARAAVNPAPLGHREEAEED